MIRLDTISRSIQLFLGAAKATNNLQIVVSYSDQTSSTYLGATQLSNSNGTTPVTICSAPAASTIRDIDMITVLNTDTVYQVVTIQYVDTSVSYKILDIQLNVGDKLTWTHGSAWQVVDNSGNVKYTVLNTSGVNSFNGRTGAVTLTNTDVNTALGFTPAPQTSGSSLLYGNGSGGFSNVTIGSGVSFSGGTLSATGSGGTVTSVGLSLPSIFSVSGSPVTGSGTLTATLNSETANTFFAAPNGSAGTPTFRALVAADVPTLNQNTTGTAASVTGATQSAITSIPNLATVGTITTGVWNGTPVANSYLANSSITINGNAVSLGGSTTVTAVNPYALTIGTGLSGTSYNGASAVTIALANSGVTAGTYGSASVIPVLTVNAQGQITSISTQATNAPSYQGTWNASTNTPTLTSSVGTQGYYYIVSVAGTTNLDGNALWSVGDWAIFGNGKWERIAGSTSESFTSLTTTNLAVTGLTGYMYANGSGNVTAATTIPTSALSGTISNAQLANSSITIGSSFLSLGGTLSTLAGVSISGSTNTLSNIGNSSLTNSSITINGNLVSLGGSTTVSANTTNALTINNSGSGAASGSTFNGGSALTISYNTVGASPLAGSTSLTTLGTITTGVWNGSTIPVAYGGTGVTSATGTGAGAAVVLSQAPAINSPVITAYSTSTVPLKVCGLSGQITELFDVYTYNGGTLAFQINSSGAIATGTWNASVIGASYGGTGVAGTLTGVLYGNGTSAHTVATASQLVSAIGSTAVTNSTNSTNTTNVLGGAANQIHYQTGSGTTSFITAPSSASTYLGWNGSAFVWGTPSGTGTVTSVALSLPSIFSVSGSPVTSSGTLTGTLATQSANLVFAGPSSGSAAAPTFRSLVAADIPALSYAPTAGSTSITTLGTITTGTWNGSVLGAAYGGTGEAGTLTGILYGNGTSAHTVATTAQLLSGIGTLPTANGGTNLTSFTSGGVLYASSSSALATSSNLIFDGKNLGIGVTPSAWGSGFNVLELNTGTSGAFISNLSNNGFLALTANAYNTGSGYLYKYSSNATLYYQQGGHYWQTAPIGTAGNTCTFTTQMQLDNGGGLRVNATGIVYGSGEYLSVNSASAAYGIGFIGNNGSGTVNIWNKNTTSPVFLNFAQGTSGLPCGSVSFNGAITVYATTSDRRLKSNISSLTSNLSGPFIDSLLPRQFTWNDSGKQDVGFIADELQSVIPNAVVGQQNATVPIGNITSTVALGNITALDGSVLQSLVAQPSEPTTGLLWVQTKSAGYVLSENVEEPQTLQPNTVWIATGNKPIYQMIDSAPAEMIAMLVCEVQSLRARLKAANIA